MITHQVSKHNSPQNENVKTKLINTEIVISYALRGGVITCALIISLGLGLSWLNPASLHHFSQETLPALTAGREVTDGDIPQSVSQFLTGLRNLNSTAVIAFGLFLLILLPVTRVALTVVLFLLERDYTYLFITLFVLCVLLSGLFFGKAL